MRIDSEINETDALLILSQFYWPEQIGAPVYVTDFAEWMAESGNETTVITGRPYYPELRLMAGYEYGQRDSESKNGVSIYRLPTFVPTGGKAVKRILNELYFLLGVIFRIISRKIVRRNRVVSFCPSILTVISGILCTKTRGHHLAVVLDIQSGLAAGLSMVRNRFTLDLFRYIEKIALNGVNDIVVLTPHMKQVLRKQGITKPISVLPIWVDPQEFKLAPTRQDKVPTLQYSGNLGHKQGIEQVLDLAEILLKERPEINILIRGGGSQFNFVKREIEQRKLINIDLCPLLPREQLPAALAQADIHLVPQNPNAADFAVPSKIYAILAIGRPIITTALPGSALYDLQKDTEGAITCVPPNSPRELAKKIISLVDNKELQKKLGNNGRRYVEASANREYILNQYIALLAT